MHFSYAGAVLRQIRLNFAAPALFVGGTAILVAGPVAALALAPAPQQAGAQTGAAVPQNATPLEATAATGPVSLRGTVTDPDDAVIPGAVVTLTPPTGKAYTATSGSDGAYTVRDVPAGTYALTVTIQGFASFLRQGVRITPGTPLTVNAKLSVQDQNTVVNVTTSQNQVSVDQDSNASASVLKGKDLDALSDDPDELSNELTALAGPAAGPNGGQIYIDGFTGGQLPPKSSIREIRINQNPFSAQYDRPGFGRVEVFTKPGTDKLHGSLQLNGLDKSFNTGSVFILPGVQQPDYHTILSFGSLTGPINKKASYNISGSLRKIQDNSVVNPPAIYGLADGTICAPGTLTTGTAACAQINNYNFVQFAPQTRYDISPRLDLALSEKNTLTARFQFEHNSAQNGNIGGNDLFSTGDNSSSHETTIQLSDSQIFSAKVINETRFEFQRSASGQTPFSTAPLSIVQGAFNNGGNSTQVQSDLTNHFEVQNYTSIALSKHFIRLGGRLRSTGENDTTTANQNGVFTYSSISNYQSGTVQNFQITNYTNNSVFTRAVDLGLYAEDDWKVKPNFTFSYGLRYETQNFIHDHKDFAPRLSGAYALGKKTVIRAGAGLFFDRFGLGNQLNVVRNNGVNQQQYTLSSSLGNLPTTCSPSNLAACPTTAGRLTVRTIAINPGGGFTNLRAGYQMQENLGVDQQLFKGATMSVNYQHIRGVHQYNSDVPDYTASPLIYQYQSNGVFNQNQLVTNVNYRGRYGSLGSYYVLNFAKSDTSGAGSFASIPNNLAADYGRASFDTRNRFFLFGSFNLPYLVTASPFLVAQSGSPYNITSGLDPFGDNTFNQRAVLVPNGTAATATAGQLVKTIGGCGTFATPGYAGLTTSAPINYCTGPADFTLNLRVSKTFGFGEKRGSAAQGSDAGGGGGRGPGGPGGGGRGPGGGGRGGFGGPGGASSGKKYNLTIGAQAANLFNIADRSAPVGTLTSPSFGQSTQLAGNIYTTDSAIRRISLQLSFSF